MCFISVRVIEKTTNCCLSLFICDLNYSNVWVLIPPEIYHFLGYYLFHKYEIRHFHFAGWNKKHSSNVMTDRPRPYACVQCPAKFYQSCHLKEHTMTKHFGFRVTCTVCSRIFSTTRALNKHLRTAHENQRV